MVIGVNGSTRICGLFGSPVKQSLSPAMHNAGFLAAGLNYAYVPFHVSPEHLPSAVEAIRVLGLAGVNVTIPHKEKVIPLLDDITREAGLLGAVNTIINHQGYLIGENTDGQGFLRSLQVGTGVALAGKKVLIIGAGGAARAVAAKLAMSGASKITLANRSADKAEQLAKLIKQNIGVIAEIIPWPEKGELIPGEVAGEADLVVQTTSLGMASGVPDPVPFPYNLIKPDQIFCDLVYNPVNTQFLKKASLSGATTVNGLGMLLYQGAISFELWTGKRAPVEMMRKALKKAAGQVLRS